MNFWIHSAVVKGSAEGYFLFCSERSSSFIPRSHWGNFRMGYSHWRWWPICTHTSHGCSCVIEVLLSWYMCMQRTLWHSGMPWRRKGCSKRWWRTFKLSYKGCWRGCKREHVTHHCRLKVRNTQTCLCINSLWHTTFFWLLFLIVNPTLSIIWANIIFLKMWGPVIKTSQLWFRAKICPHKYS